MQYEKLPCHWGNEKNPLTRAKVLIWEAHLLYPFWLAHLSRDPQDVVSDYASLSADTWRQGRPLTVVLDDGGSTKPWLQYFLEKDPGPVVMGIRCDLWWMVSSPLKIALLSHLAQNIQVGSIHIGVSSAQMLHPPDPCTELRVVVHE